MSAELREVAQELAFEWYGAREPHTQSVIWQAELYEGAMKRAIAIDGDELLKALKDLIHSLVGDEFADDIPAVVAARSAIEKADARRSDENKAPAQASKTHLMETWKPVCDAPRDGRDILLTSATWFGDAIIGGFHFGAWRSRPDPHAQILDPTHFMIIPDLNASAPEVDV